jgi:hypothetical protein
MAKEAFSDLLEEVGMDLLTARDMRYNAVFHLVTAATGAESFYTLENNPKARYTLFIFSNLLSNQTIRINLYYYICMVYLKQQQQQQQQQQLNQE